MADTYDLLTLSEGKNAVNVLAGETDYDVELGVVITAASQRIVDLCGPVVNRTFTNETYSGGDNAVILRNAAIGDLATTTVSSFAEYSSSGAATVLSAEDYDTKPTDAYLVDAETGIVYRRAGGTGAFFVSGHRNVVITYTSGRGASTAAVPAKFKEAAKLLVAHLWRERGPEAGAFRGDTDGGSMFGVAPFALPNAVVDMLRAEIRVDRVFGVG